MRKRIREYSCNIHNKIMCGLATVGSLVCAPFPVIAQASDNLSWLKNGGDGTFDEVNKTLQGAGASLYQVFLTLGIIGLVISLSLVGLGIAVNKNAAKKSENKSHLIDIAIGGCVIFGAFFIIGLIQTVATKLGG